MAALLNRLRHKQASRRISRDDLDLHRGIPGNSPSNHGSSPSRRGQKWHSQRPLPSLPISPRRDGYISSSSCENIYEEISEEFMKEIVRRKPVLDDTVVSSSEDDYGFHKFKKQDTSKARTRIARNVRGILSSSKTKLFSVKDEEPQKDTTASKTQATDDSSMAILPDVLYTVDVASPKVKQVCRCTHQHPQAPLRSHHSTSAVSSTVSQQPPKCSIHPSNRLSSTSSLPTNISDKVIPQTVVQSANKDISNFHQPQPQTMSYPDRGQLPMDNLKAENRNSCTDSITPYFGGGSDSGVSVSSEGSSCYGNAMQLSPSSSNGYQGFQYRDSVFADPPRRGLHTVWEQEVLQEETVIPAQHVQNVPHQPQYSHQAHHVGYHQLSGQQQQHQMLHHQFQNTQQHHGYSTHQYQQRQYQQYHHHHQQPQAYHTQHTLPQPASSQPYPAQTLYPPQAHNPMDNHPIPRNTQYPQTLPHQPPTNPRPDSKLDYLMPSCEHPTTTTATWGPPGRDEGFSEPQAGESSFVRRAREKIIAKLKHLDLAELEATNNGMLDLGISPLIWEEGDQGGIPAVPMSPPLDMDDPCDPAASAFRPYIAQGELQQVYSDNEYYHSQPPSEAEINQSQHLFQPTEVFTSISLRKGLQDIDTGTLSPVSEPPPPLPKRCPQRVQVPSVAKHRPVPSVPQGEDMKDTQQFQRSKSLMHPSQDSVEANTRSDSPEVVANFQRKGVRKAMQAAASKLKDKDQNFKRSKSLMIPETSNNADDEVRSDSPEVVANFSRQGFRKPIHGRRSVSSENSSTESECEGVGRRRSRASKSRERHTSTDSNLESDTSSKTITPQDTESKENTPVKSLETSKSSAKATSKTNQSSKSKSDCTKEHSVHNVLPYDTKQAFKPVVPKRQSKTPPPLDSGDRLGVRVKGQTAAPNGGLKPPGHNSALTDLLRRNHDRQLLVFV